MQLLDHQTLNEARRVVRQQLLDTMSRFMEGEPGHDAARVLAMLAEGRPRRAILRDLIVDAKSDLHRWSPLVRAVIRRIPRLRSWALAPLR